MRLNKISLAALVLAGSALLAACGGGGDSPAPQQVVKENATLAINPTSGPALVTAILDKEFTFNDAIPEFGTSAATTLKLTGTGAAPKFELTSGGATAKGDMTFGSCIFTVRDTTFTPPSLLASIASSIPVSSCAFFLPFSGFIASAPARPVDLQWVLGYVKSIPVPVPVSFSPSGGVTLNGSNVGNINLVTATGATGGGN